MAWASATVRHLGSDRHELTVVVKKPPRARVAPGEDSSREGADRVLDALHRAAAAHKLRVEGTDDCPSFEVVAAALMVPRRVPREIPRGSVLRLEVVGTGVAGVVSRAHLSDPSGRGPARIVAIKEAKRGDALSRRDAENEAAVMALAGDHPHIVALMGVVTVPQTMPMLLVLEYCERGSLDRYLQAEGAATSSMALRLLLCGDVASGMGFLASRRVVHRDLAARNVLLDATLACKVSDFGLAALLPRGGAKSPTGEYLETYVRLNGVRPIRWSAVEVLESSRFSSASPKSLLKRRRRDKTSRRRTPAKCERLLFSSDWKG